MKSFYDKERECSLLFEALDKCFHLWTPEDFEVIFTCDEDFRIGMGIIGIAAKLFPDINIITFELMSNHLHITACCRNEQRLREMFVAIEKMLVRFSRHSGRYINWDGFKPGVRDITTLEDLRNVIVYNNRNGYVVSPDHTPFTYPWGANRYFFNPDAQRLASDNVRPMTVREIRRISHTHTTDSISGLMSFDSCALPLSFCDVAIGERIFRDRSHYFYKLSKNIESNMAIAKEIGERLFYNDDELFSVISKISKDRYNTMSPSTASSEAKIEMAKIMRFDYNASTKQITRMLKIQQELLSAMGL